MCTQGDPLADLGYVLNYWVEPDDNPEWREIASMPTWRDGFPSRAEAIERYAARTGFDAAPILWHQVFAAFKLAVIIQQIYIRFVRGQTSVSIPRASNRICVSIWRRQKDRCRSANSAAAKPI